MARPVWCSLLERGSGAGAALFRPWQYFVAMIDDAATMRSPVNSVSLFNRAGDDSDGTLADESPLSPKASLLGVRCSGRLPERVIGADWMTLNADGCDACREHADACGECARADGDAYAVLRLGHTWFVNADGARRAAGNRIVLVMSEPVRYETRVQGSDVAVERCRRMEP